MSNFDFSDIQEVNRIVLQPNEMVMFRIAGMTQERVEQHKKWFKGTPLEGRMFFVDPSVEVKVITAETNTNPGRG
jgi:hypothetical protein